MTRILVPYHLDEHRPNLDVPVAPDLTITAKLPDGDPWTRMASLYEWVASAVADAVRNDARPVVVSGDCTTSLGTMAGLQRAGEDPAIVWFDGHGDVQTVETTTSGYLGGMPLRILLGYRPDLISDRLGIRPVPEHRVVLVDARDLDPPEVEYLRQAAVRRVDVADLTGDVLPNGPLYLHLDLDVADPGDVPGLLFPAPGGPSLAAVADAVRRVIQTGQVAAVGVGCTWHPGHGAAERVRPAVETVLSTWR